MNRRTLALGIALAYPEYAFAGEPFRAVTESREIIDRAGRGDNVDRETAELLSRYVRLNEWAEQLLEDKDLVPPHLQRDEVRSYNPLPGHGEPVQAPKYICPLGHSFVWYRMSVAEVVPPCSFCHSRLTRAR